ncbi:hypothetical protein [Adlercreutzia shanghongiae]|uniref:Uncharacterized protein n=1 Tax=Adlercreutzia shanghongiae TaxID=3111773 RepID=A0ABU6IZF9_9ACTN|nr:hypothetical protein [Adlercreutzia sp. R22]MEC4294879.1 hypothetical protein [Adlercreutzia sp. R22]
MACAAATLSMEDIRAMVLPLLTNVFELSELDAGPFRDTVLREAVAL